MPYPYYQTPYQPMGYGYNNYAPVSAQNAAGAQQMYSGGRFQPERDISRHVKVTADDLL